MKKIKNNKLNTKFNKYLLLLLLTLTLFSIFYGHYSLNTKELLWDEPVYLSNAASHIRTANFTEDFRFPLLEFVISFIWFIFGESILYAKLFIIFISISTLFTFYFLSKNYLSPTKSLIATILFGVSSQFLFWSFRIYTDILALFFILLSFFFLTKPNKNLFLVGLFLAFAFLSRFIFVFGLTLFVYFLITRKWDSLKHLIFGAFIGLFPWLTYNILKYNNPFWDFIQQIRVIGEYTQFQSPHLFFHNLYSVFSFSFFFIFFFFLFFFFKKQKTKEKNKFLFLYLFFNTIFYLFIIRLKLLRYTLMFIPFVILSSFIGINWFMDWFEIRCLNNIKNNKKRTIKSFLYITLLVFFSFGIFLSTQHQLKEINYLASCSEQSARLQTIEYMRNLTLENKTISSNSWPWYGYYLNTKTYSLWNKNLSEFIEKTKTDYVIIDTSSGLDVQSLNWDNVNKEKINNFEDICGMNITIYKINHN